MPVYEYTHTPSGFFKLGALKKGEKRMVTKKNKETGRDYEAEAMFDLDYWRIVFAPGKTAKALEEAFRAAYGPKPTEINVRLNGRSVSDVWDVSYVCYKQGGEVCRAGSNENGLYWTYYRDPNTLEVLVRNGSPVGMAGREFMDKPISLETPIYHNSKNEPQFMELEGRLKVVIKELADIDVGYFEFCPGSPRDLRNISAELAAYEEMAKLYNKTINGIPFILLRREEEITKKINGKLTRGPSWVVHLKADGAYASRALSVIERLALPDVVEGEVLSASEPETGPEWEDFEPEVPQIPAKVEAPKETPRVTVQESTPDLPSTAEELRKVFAKEYNAALKVVKSRNLPTIKGNSTPDEIKEAIAGIRALVAANS